MPFNLPIFFLCPFPPATSLFRCSPVAHPPNRKIPCPPLQFLRPNLPPTPPPPCCFLFCKCSPPLQPQSCPFPYHIYDSTPSFDGFGMFSVFFFLVWPLVSVKRLNPDYAPSPPLSFFLQGQWHSVLSHEVGPWIPTSETLSRDPPPPRALSRQPTTRQACIHCTFFFLPPT